MINKFNISSKNDNLYVKIVLIEYNFNIKE